jgi:hypothetical protein
LLESISTYFSVFTFALGDPNTVFKTEDILGGRGVGMRPLILKPILMPEFWNTTTPIIIPESSKGSILKAITQYHNTTPTILGLSQVRSARIFTGQVIPVETIFHGGYTFSPGSVQINL